ncbi:MAG: hypothetical protein KY453_07350 [Gemmatimonadetes bacterium]|nr:hypothetical protein [Gemmatimonadota bacterium]
MGVSHVASVDEQAPLRAGAERLEAGDRSATTSVQVRLDPRVSPAPQAVAARQAALLDVAALQGPLVAARRRAGDLQAHLDELRGLIRDAEGDHPALLERVDTLEARVEEVEDALDAHGRVGRLGSSIESAFERPTSDQLWQIERAWEEVPPAVERLNALLSDEVPALHRELDRLGIRRVPGEPVPVPRRPGG